MSLRRLLLACLVPLAWPSAAAAADIDIPFPECGLEVHLGADCCGANATAKFRLTVMADYCSRVSALTGDLSLVDLPVENAGLAVVVGIRPDPDAGGCPAVEMPFDLEVRLPEPLPLAGPPSVIPLTFYLSYSDGQGPPTILRCGELDLPAPDASDAARLNLHDGRFTATVQWSLPSGATGSGTAIPDSVTSQGGLFSFFGAENPELLVKVLDGCAVNNHFWVLGSASTNVHFVLQISDSATGTSWRHENAQDTLAPAFADTAAFPCPGS